VPFFLQKPQRLKPLCFAPTTALWRAHQATPLRIQELTLALAVLRIGTDHAHHTAPMNDFAFHANLLDRCPNFHNLVPPFLPSAAKAGEVLRCNRTVETVP
jgi:hypothetical protein